jgi:hypothetical protein
MPRQRNTVEIVEPEFEIDEQLELQEKGWVIQRVGWIMIIAVMIAGALGLFGNGWISNQTSSSGNVKAEFERFFRYETEMKVLVESSDHISSISFPQKYLKDFRIIHFVPEPFNNNTTGNEVRYNFLKGQNKIVSVYLVPKSYGSIDGSLKVNETIVLNLDHFIFP